MGLRTTFSARSIRSASAIAATAAIALALIGAVPAATSAPPSPRPEGYLQAAAPNEVVIRQATTTMTYHLYNLGFADTGDRCRVELRNAEGGPAVDVDGFVITPGMDADRTLTLTAKRVEAAGRGAYRMRLLCETSELRDGAGGTEPWPLAVLAATRTTVVRAPSRPTKVVTTTQRYFPRGWGVAPRAWVSLQRRAKDGTWQTTVSTRTDARGRALFTRPDGIWRARTMRLDGLADSVAYLPR